MRSAVAWNGKTPSAGLSEIELTQTYPNRIPIPYEQMLSWLQEHGYSPVPESETEVNARCPACRRAQRTLFVARMEGESDACVVRCLKCRIESIRKALGVPAPRPVQTNRRGEQTVPGPVAGETPSLGPRVVCLSQVKPEKVQWLWYGYIPFGKITMLDGDPGLGKSTLTLDLAACLSRGRPMPNSDLETEAAGVLILSAEDGIADTVVPRLKAADADLDRIHAFDNTAALPTLPDQIALIEEQIMEYKARLVLIDPFMAFLSEGVKSHVDQDIRRALAPLAGVAQATGAAVVMVRHLNKLAGGDPLYRGGGSIGIVGAARSALLVGKDPQDPDRCILAHYKGNLTRTPPSLVYRLESLTSDTEVARVVWEGISELSARALLVGGASERALRPRERATECLEEWLAEGPVKETEIAERAAAEGLSPSTVKRARRRIGVKAQKIGAGPEGYWALSLQDTGEGKPKKVNGAKAEKLTLFEETDPL